MKRTFIVSALLAIMVPSIVGQAGDPATLQQKLNASFKITILAANNSDIATPGDVVELHKDGIRLSALNTVLTESNTYKDGKIGGGAAKRAWGSFGTSLLQGVAAGLDPSGATTVSTGPPPRILAAGDKCWILAITVQKDGVVFKLITDPNDNGMRYHGDLKILFPNKKQVPSADVILPMIAEVLSVVQSEPPPEPEVVAPPPPPPTRYDELAPPPSPPAPVVTVGESRTQVITDFGQPQKKSVVGAKTLYFYTDLKMKVTFINGKVSSID